MATKAVQNAWFAGAVGRPMNPDNAYGLQCKDVPDDYCVTLFGNWVNTIRPGNGKDVVGNANPTFFTKVYNNPNDPSQIPPHGAIISYGASRAVPEGHTAVVDSATSSNVTVIQQDGYLQYAARRVVLPYALPNGAPLIGWLIPRIDPDPAVPPKANDDQIRQAYLDLLERPADDGGILHYRNFTIDFVRADLQASAEYRQVQFNKAAAAQAAADAKLKAEAEAAEAARLAELQAAAEAAQKAADEAKAESEKANEQTPITDNSYGSGNYSSGSTPGKTVTTSPNKLMELWYKIILILSNFLQRRNTKKKS